MNGALKTETTLKGFLSFTIQISRELFTPWITKLIKNFRSVFMDGDDGAVAGDYHENEMKLSPL